MNNPFEEKFPPVKTPERNQVVSEIKDGFGKPQKLYVSKEVAGKLHFICPSSEMWIDVTEIYDILNKLNV